MTPPWYYRGMRSYTIPQSCPLKLLSQTTRSVLCKGGVEPPHSKAEPLFQRALAIREKALGPEHPNVAKVLKNYAGLHCKMKRGAAARELEVRAWAIRAAHAKINPPSKD